MMHNEYIEREIPADAGMAHYSEPPLHTKPLYLSIAGFCLDLALLWLFYSQGFTLNLSHTASFTLAYSICGLTQLMWPLRTLATLALRTVLTEAAIFLLLIFLRGGILTSLIWLLDFPAKLAFFICVATTWIIHAAIRIWQSTDGDSAIKRRYLLIFIIAYSVLLRLAYLGTPELFYEEAYYWNYAKHLDIGYLDHPPLIALIIAFGTSIFGDNEFGVRCGALLCWVITSIFICRLISMLFPQRFVILQSMALLAALPIFFGTGWAMTPDAPLMASWAALLYFLHQALLRDQKSAWLGIGITLGLGMLAKYTIILLGAATLLIILVDRSARKWLFQPQPYGAVLIAIILFSPVLIWNYQHEWASFLYQGKNHISGADRFALHYFIAGILIILTPVGFILAMLAIRFRRELYTTGIADAERTHRIFMILGIIPIAVFAIVSITHETKFHWTAPAWLALLPFMALLATSQQLNPLPTSRVLTWASHALIPTLLTGLILYGGFFHYVTLGLFGIPYPQQLYLLGWTEFGKEMGNIIQLIEHNTGEKPLVVGMDRNRTASGLAFYINKALQNNGTMSDYDPTQQTASWHLFAKRSLMYEYWFPLKDQEDKTLLLVARNRSDLQSEVVLNQVAQLSEVKRISILKNGKPVVNYYYALAHGYRSRLLHQ